MAVDLIDGSDNDTAWLKTETYKTASFNEKWLRKNHEELKRRVCNLRADSGQPRPPPTRRCFDSESPRRRHLRLCVSTTAVLLLLSAAVCFLFPSDPALSLARIQLNHVGVHSSPKLTLDVSFSLTIKVRNRDFFSLDYESLRVRVGYRGRELGFVSSAGARVRARGASYVNATLVVDGLEVIHDVFYLLEDLARGVIPFDTDTEVDGTVELFFFNIPIKGRASCEVYVNTNDQTVDRQDCYPE